MADNYKQLIVWKESMQLAKTIYNATSKFPKEEIYGLCSQIRRAAVSIPSNIAEGSVRRAPKDFTRFINIARGSLAELETQLILATELKYISNDNLEIITKMTNSIGKMLNGLRKSLEENHEPRTTN